MKLIKKKEENIFYDQHKDGWTNLIFWSSDNLCWLVTEWNRIYVKKKKKWIEPSDAIEKSYTSQFVSILIRVVVGLEEYGW